MQYTRLPHKAWGLLKSTAVAFLDDNAIKLSAALSYYTIFALPPLLILIITLAGFFFGKDAVTGELYGQINGLVGNAAAIQIQAAIKNVELSGDNFLATVIGGSMLLIGASGVFAEIQSSINFIWGLRAQPDKALKSFLKNRLMSFSMIASLGFLMMVSLIVNFIFDIMKSKLMEFFPEGIVYLFYILNFLVVFGTITLLFLIIFKTLPDGKIKSRDAGLGSALTAILFLIGKFAISLYLQNSNVASVYGAAGSVIVILVWVYYSSIILYFGAEFTKVYAKKYGGNISPSKFSVEINKETIEINEDN